MARIIRNTGIYFPEGHENIPEGAAWGNIMTWGELYSCINNFPGYNSYVTHLLDMYMKAYKVKLGLQLQDMKGTFILWLSKNHDGPISSDEFH